MSFMPDILNRVVAIYCDVLGAEHVTLDDDVLTLGGDSVQAVRLLLELERQFEVEIPLEVLEENGSVRAVIAYIEAQRPNAAE